MAKHQPPAVEKRKVTMTNASVVAIVDGEVKTETHVATDYVPLEFLDAYVADAKTRWQSVEVGDEHDPGPGGDDGDTDHPEHLRRGVSLEQHLAEQKV